MTSQEAIEIGNNIKNKIDVKYKIVDLIDAFRLIWVMRAYKVKECINEITGLDDNLYKEIGNRIKNLTVEDLKYEISNQKRV